MLRELEPIAKEMMHLAKEGPGNLRIQLVDYCNLRCYFCHNEGSPVENQSLDLDMMWKIMGASSTLGRESFRFTGGEPTLHPDFSKIILTTRDKFPEAVIGFTTNGTVLKKLSKEVFLSGVDKMNVSLHSLDEALYKKITDKDYLPRVLDNLDYLDTIGFKSVTLNMVLDADNLGELESIASYASAKSYQLDILDIKGSEYSEVRFDVKDCLEEISNKYKDLDIREKPKKYHPKCIHCQDKPYCGEGAYLRVDTNARLVPCMYRKDLVIPVLASDGVQELLDKVALGYVRISHDDASLKNFLKHK